jgi:hypothetical protein
MNVLVCTRSRAHAGHAYKDMHEIQYARMCTRCNKPRLHARIHARTVQLPAACEGAGCRDEVEQAMRACIESMAQESPAMVGENAACFKATVRGGV